MVLLQLVLMPFQEPLNDKFGNNLLNFTPLVAELPQTYCICHPTCPKLGSIACRIACLKALAPKYAQSIWANKGVTSNTEFTKLSLSGP